MQLTDDIFKVDGVRVGNVYLVAAAGGLLVVDTGVRGSAKRILAVAHGLGRRATDIRYIVLTHSDLDHAGSAAALRALTHATLAVHELDAPVVAGKEPPKGGRRMAALYRLLRFRPVQADLLLKEGDSIAGFRVMHVPGHTAGSIALYRDDGVVFSGDTLLGDKDGLMRPPDPRLALDPAQTLVSAERIKTLPMTLLLPGHGAPVRTERRLPGEGVMKAIVQRRFGPPDVLRVEETERPAPADGEALVRVRAASVNPADWHAVRGRPFLVRLVGYGLRRPRHRTPGTDVAGVVEAVGPDVTGLRPGDEVFGWARGSYAEFAIARVDRLALKPGEITFQQAAAVPTAAVTALQGLRDAGRLATGQHVLVIGASGGVGTFAVQIAKAFGAEVTGVCSTRNVEFVRSNGADEMIDHTRQDVVRSGRRYDLILQLAGTRSPLALRRILRPGGTLVLCSGDGWSSGLDRIALAAAASGFVPQRLVAFVARQSDVDLATLKGLIEAGSIRPILDRTYPLVETPDAVRYVEARHTRGKVAITV